MQRDQLAALLAIVDGGTFDAAARNLRITPSAVSQRIKALERQVGRPVVRRTVPCTPSPAGQVLVRMARQLRLLEEDTAAALQAQEAGAGDLPIAVNADSLATWFAEVLRTAAGWADTVLRLHVEDEDHSAALLRSGEVIGAVTADPVPAVGCSVTRLGSMRYVAVVDPGLLGRYTRDGSADLGHLPVLRFNEKDDIQDRLLAAIGVTGPAAHRIPTSQGFLAAVRTGLGWGMLPVLQLGDDLSTGALVRLPVATGSGEVDVPLYWQAWRLDSPRIDRVREAVLAAARAGLR
jgi:LysR family transcriptional regulator (chromosome initiation inhibitor)